MIKVQDQLFNIIAGQFSLILGVHHGYVTVKHLGGAIDEYRQSNPLVEKDHAFSGGPYSDDRTYSPDTQRHVVGQLGRSDFRQPSVIIEHHQNQVTDFKFESAEVLKEFDGPKGLPMPRLTAESEILHLQLIDEVASLKLHLYYVTYPEYSTIGQFTKIENIGDETVNVHKLLSAMIDLPNGQYDLMTLQGYYGMERKVVRQPLQQGLIEIGSIRGSSGHGQTPALILLDHLTQEEYGEALSLQLMYSGNFEAFAQTNQLGELRLGIGINETQFSYDLAPGASFDTPFVIYQHTYQGLNALTQLSHQFIQAQILPQPHQYQLRPILINNWEATYFDFNSKKLKAIAKQAAEVGIELFVLDDGWFGKRQNDLSSLGDWVVNTEKLGGELSELIDYVHDLGLQFGLWIEPEMISEDSDLYRQHPDWVIQVPGRSHTYSRSQLVLNLANPEVVSYLKATFDELLANHKIDYIKWDSNRNISDVGNGSTYLDTMKQSHQYVLGLYELASYLTNKYPNILFESCSGGGGRNDLGMMAYFDQTWTSDNTDAIERLNIQYGSSMLFPAIHMGAHVSAAPNHQMKRMTSLNTRGHVAMMGNLGYELDITSMTEAQLMKVSQQVATYKTIRPVIQLGKQVRLMNPLDSSNQPQNYTAVQHYNDETVVLTVVKVLSTMEKMEPVVKLKHLELNADYQLVGKEHIIYSGAELMYAGISLNFPPGDFVSQQWVFKRIK